MNELRYIGLSHEPYMVIPPPLKHLVIGALLILRMWWKIDRVLLERKASD